jgi:hypothetical protein
VAQLIASTEFMVRFGASYLVAEYPEGTCLVDVLLDWDQRRSGFDTDFKTRWETTPSGLRLHVLAHRVMHDELDEGSKPGADVTGNQCERYVYEVRDGKFQRISHDSRVGPCKGR